MKVLYFLALAFFCFSGCASPSTKELPRSLVCPSIRSDLPLNEHNIPLLKVYVQDENLIREIDVETYLAGVVAGEMKNDWPLEALKAQAILARTFVMRFVSEKESRYEGADISTDISEAQAYNSAAVNDLVLSAVAETEGLVLTDAEGNLPYTWFHAHSGGTTALAREALGWSNPEPAHTRITAGMDSEAAPTSVKTWSAVFSAADFTAACRRAGIQPSHLSSVSIKEKGQSGRTVTLAVNDMEVNAARLRIELGSTVMRSTLLDELSFADGKVYMAGRGYGHGVGMPQWGAYALALDGWSGEEIALHYYNGLQIVRIWPLEK